MPWSAAISAVAGTTVAYQQMKLKEAEYKAQAEHRRMQHMLNRAQYRQDLKEGLDAIFGTNYTGVHDVHLGGSGGAGHSVVGIAGMGGTGGASSSMENARYQAVERYSMGWSDPFLTLREAVPALPVPEVIEIPPPTFKLRWYHHVMWRLYKAAIWMRDKL